MTRFLLLVILIGIVLVFGSRIFTALYSKPLMKTAKTIQPTRVAIVFGAGLQWDGSPSPILRDRVETAVDLYKAGTVEKLLMSGDNRFVDYNEPGAMRSYAIELGVPEEDIVLDYAGRRTYDTCFRAKNIFKVDEAILVTQNYHLPRALFTCSALGISSQGFSADKRVYSIISKTVWNVREIPASLKALWDVWIWHPRVVLGDPEPIFTDNK